jgi:hypothetical protein
MVVRQGRRHRAGRARLTRATSASSMHSQACHCSSRVSAPQARLLLLLLLCFPSFRRPNAASTRLSPAHSLLNLDASSAFPRALSLLPVPRLSCACACACAGACLPRRAASLGRDGLTPTARRVRGLHARPPALVRVRPPARPVPPVPAPSPRVRPPPAQHALPRPARRPLSLLPQPHSAERSRAERGRAALTAAPHGGAALPKRLQQPARGAVRMVGRLLRCASWCAGRLFTWSETDFRNRSETPGLVVVDENITHGCDRSECR